MFKLRLTPIFIISVLGLLFLIPTTFYYLFINNNGGMALAGVISGLYSIVVGFILVSERLILKDVKVNQKKIWVIELIIILFSMIIYTML